MKLTKNQKILAGVGALAGLLFLSRGSEQIFTGTNGGFGGAGSGLDDASYGSGLDDVSSAPELSPNTSSPFNFNFPTYDTGWVQDFIAPSKPADTWDSWADEPEKSFDGGTVLPQTITKKESLSPTITNARESVSSARAAISPSALKANSTKTAIMGSNLSPEAKTDVMNYVGTPGNVMNEQIKKAKEYMGINLLSQLGNEFSEYTDDEKARSKAEANLFEKITGVLTSPLKEEPRIVTAAKNILSGGSKGTGEENVKIIPVTEMTDAMAASNPKKEAAAAAAAQIADAGWGNSIPSLSPGSSKGSSSSTPSVKKATPVSSSGEKKSWTLAEVKAGKNRR